MYMYIFGIMSQTNFFFFFYLINLVISATLFSAIFLKYYWYEYICCAQYDVQLLGFELQCQRK